MGIGAGPDTDGQVLVVHDMLGITHDFKPRFLRQYADLSSIISKAVGHYVKDIKSLNFPNSNESY
ncbi:MAG: 3-methyl-2-oxobutanoate hydroxymethyltransferase [Cyclobacteriaceae bacterium]